MKMTNSSIVVRKCKLCGKKFSTNGLLEELDLPCIIDKSSGMVQELFFCSIEHRDEYLNKMLKGS